MKCWYVWIIVVKTTGTRTTGKQALVYLLHPGNKTAEENQELWGPVHKTKSQNEKQESKAWYSIYKGNWILSEIEEWVTHFFLVEGKSHSTVESKWDQWYFLFGFGEGKRRGKGWQGFQPG